MQYDTIFYWGSQDGLFKHFFPRPHVARIMLYLLCGDVFMPQCSTCIRSPLFFVHAWSFTKYDFTSDSFTQICLWDRRKENSSSLFFFLNLLLHETQGAVSHKNKSSGRLPSNLGTVQLPSRQRHVRAKLLYRLNMWHWIQHESTLPCF